MSTASIERSAKRFVIQWRDTERDLFQGLRSSLRPRRLDALQRATSHFIIARNFARAFDVQAGRARLEPVLEIFDEVRQVPLRAGDLESAVMQLARRLGSAYGGRILISAATKLLWLAHRHPAVIYDSRACRTLGVSPGNYAAYLAKWRAAFGEQEADLRAICARLAMSASKDAPLSHDIGAEWFRHRVFDIYLYDAGTPG